MQPLKKLSAGVLLYTLTTAAFSQQILLTKEWSTNAGTQTMFRKSRSRTDAAGNVYIIGETVNGNGNYDWLIEKYTATGSLDWNSQVNGTADLDDFIADIFIDASGNVYVVGAVVQNASDSLDICVRKYTSAGSVSWTQYYNGSDSRNDVGTSIHVDGSGNVYITGTEGTNADMQDCITRKYNSSGSLLWTQRYDYTGLHDAGAFVQISPGLSNVLIVTAGSQGSALSWDVATILYNATTGAMFTSNRISGGTGTFYEVSDAVLDASGNLYIVGSYATLLGDVDIKVIKINSSYTLDWEETYSGPVTGGEDKGNAVRVDGSGNVYVTGYVTRSGQGKNAILLKYNSSGVLQYDREYNGMANGDDAGNSLTFNTLGDVYIAGYTHETNTSGKDYLTMSYKSNGDFRWRKTFNGAAGLDDEATDIAMGDNQSIIVTGQCSGGAALQFTTIKWEEYEDGTATVDDGNGEPQYKANEIVIAFRPDQVKAAFVNDPDRQFGKALDVVDSLLVVQMNAKLGINLFANRDARLLKIFSQKTTDTLSYSRSGYPVPRPQFWRVFTLRLPNTIDEQDAIDSLETLAGVDYAELNGVLILAGSNDPLFNAGDAQSSIKHTTTYPDADINVDSAWVYDPGRTFLKIGVLDNGIFYAHEDFGNASPGSLSGSKIIGGVNRDDPNTAITNLSNTFSYFDHGTQVAGIIGALRNNNTGISGIAGGDMDSSNTGVQLVDIRVCCKSGANQDATFMTRLASGIDEGATSGPNLYNGVHIMNMSLAGNNNSNGKTLRNAVVNARQNEVVLIASRGGSGNTTIPVDTSFAFPACFDSEWLISVGASGNNGRALRSLLNNGNSGNNTFTLSGRGMDFLAPGATQNVTTTGTNVSTYTNFGSSSSATAHITGAAALLMSDFQGKSVLPDNLNYEDIEQILAYTADNLDAPGTYTQRDGWGRINVKRAMDVLQKPYYSLLHFTAWLDNTHLTLEAGNLADTMGGFTIVDVLNNPITFGTALDQYKIAYTINHQNWISPNAQILGYWIRNSYSDAWGDWYSVTVPSGNPARRTNGWSDVEFDFFTADSARVYGYFYNLPNTGNAWFPFHPNSNRLARLSYSVHVYDSTGVTSLEEETIADVFNLYPNPSADQITLQFALDKTQDVTAEIWDMSGRKCGEYKTAHMQPGINLLTLPVYNLAPGTYSLRLLTDKGVKSSLFIKQ